MTESLNRAPAGIDLDKIQRYGWTEDTTLGMIDLRARQDGAYVKFADVESLLARRAAPAHELRAVAQSILTLWDAHAPDDSISDLHKALRAALAHKAEPDAPAADEREAFEAWLRSRWPNAVRPIDEKTVTGSYAFTENNLLWEAWQARAAHPIGQVSPAIYQGKLNEEKHARAAHQGASAHEANDAGGTGAGGRTGAHEHHEHRARQSGSDGCDGVEDGGSAGVSDRGQVREAVAPSDATGEIDEAWARQLLGLTLPLDQLSSYNRERVACVLLGATGKADAASAGNDELPGMWEQADIEGGETDAANAGESGLIFELDTGMFWHMVSKAAGQQDQKEHRRRLLQEIANTVAYCMRAPATSAADAKDAGELQWHKEALAAVRAKLDAVWEGIREAVQKYSGAPCEGEPFDRLDELLSRLSRANGAELPKFSCHQIPVTTYLAPDGVTRWPAYSFEQRQEYARAAIAASRKGGEA